jgi:hypothetical protein
MLTFNDAYRVTAPRISRERFQAIGRERFASAVLAERDPGEYYDAILTQKDEQGRFVDPLFVLIMFEHESTYGKAGAARETHSWGNTRPPSFGALEVGRLDQIINGKLNGQFSIYASWRDGCISTAMRLLHKDAPYAGRLAILEIFEHPSGRVWAPAGDHNNPTSYINAIVSGMNRDGDQIGAPPVGTVAKPPMRTDYRTPNQGGYSFSEPRIAEAISNHISDGSEIGDLSWLTKHGSGAGCNYYINKGGVIYELAPWQNAAWTNGPWGNPDLTNPLIAAWYRAGINSNTRTISKEFEGKPNDLLTDAQIRSSNHLDAWLSEQASIILDRTHYIGHYQIDSINRSYCPSFDPDEWDDLINGARAYFVDTTTEDERVFDVPGVGPIIVAKGFLRYYDTFGGLDRDGWPLTPEFVENGMTVQYFERSRFEWHPGVWPERWDVLRGRVGAELLELELEVAELKAKIEALKEG